MPTLTAVLARLEGAAFERTAVMLVLVAAFMVIELRVSRRHERALVALGATTPPDPAYRAMRWAYPGTFVAMSAEGVMAATLPRSVFLAGLVVFLASKVLKTWAIRTLGNRWTYRVHVLPGAPLVTGGPYRLVRHPNYIAVVGELVGFGLCVGAIVTGPLSVVMFGWLLRGRIRAEERALQLR